MHARVECVNYPKLYRMVAKVKHVELNISFICLKNRHMELMVFTVFR